MGVKHLLICDDRGYPYYTKTFKDFERVEPSLLSGLISAISNIGKRLFKENIAQIKFGMDANHSQIGIISKEIFNLGKEIYFVYFYDGKVDLKFLREISTNLFIELKHYFHQNMIDPNTIAGKADTIIERQYNNLAYL